MARLPPPRLLFLFTLPRRLGGGAAATYLAEFVGTYLLVLTIGSAGRYALTDLLWLSCLHTKSLRQMYQHMRVF